MGKIMHEYKFWMSKNVSDLSFHSGLWSHVILSRK